MQKQSNNKSNMKKIIAAGAATAVLAGGLGFQTYQVHQLGEDLTKVEKKYSQTVQNLNETTKKYDDLLLLNKKVEAKATSLEENVKSLTDENTTLQKQVKEEQTLVDSKNEEIAKLRSELNREKASKTTSSEVSPRSRELVSRGSSSSNVKATYTMTASAYSTYENGDSLAGSKWGNLTASGTTVKQGRTIAVDKNLIPLGTKVRLTFPEGWKHMDGVYICEDTGNAIVGNRIDVYFDSYQTCIQFGKREVKLEVLS